MEMFRPFSYFEFYGKRQLENVDIYSDYIYFSLTAVIHQICHVTSRCFARRPTHVSTLTFKHFKIINFFLFKCSYFKKILSYFL
jgi:hypothetical protein